MAQGETPITIIGNIVDDPELRFTPTGQAVARFRIASTPRFYDKNTNEWKDGEGLFLTCNVWRQMAENVCESLIRGSRVIVQGRLKQRSYEVTKGESQGQKRTVYEVEVDEVGPSLKWSVAKPVKTDRNGNSNTGGGISEDPWASAAPANKQPAGAANHGGGNGGGDFPDDPPF